MINNFIEVVTQTFEKLCNEKLTIIKKDTDVVEVAFEKFSIVIYYCAYEYDLGYNYSKKGKETHLEYVLQELGCGEEQLPKYKYMSNAEVMANYLGEYIKLINQYFNELSSFNIKKLK